MLHAAPPSGRHVALITLLNCACPALTLDPIVTDGSTGAPPDPATTTGQVTDGDGTTTALTGDTSSGTTGPGTGSTANLDDTGLPGSTTAAETGASTGPDASSSGGAGGCGDGVVDPGEACDDGNADEADGCLSSCEFVSGVPLMPVKLPPLLANEQLRCFTAIDKAQIGSPDHVLTIGSAVVAHGPTGQMGGMVRAVPLPDGDPAAWTYLEHAGIYGRLPQRAVTAPNGDVIVAGLVYTEQVDLDSGGYLWIARFAPDGALVWSHEYMDIIINTEDMVLGPDGDIILTGPAAPFISLSFLHVFDSTGQPKWDNISPAPAMSVSNYRGVAVDDDGTIYTVAAISEWNSSQVSTQLRAFSPAGALLWETAPVSPFQPSFNVASMVRTANDVLMFAGTQRGADSDVPELALAAYSTDGDPLWWKEWTPPNAGSVNPFVLVAAPDGGMYVAGGYTNVPYQAFVSRFDATGTNLWANTQPGWYVGDALLGPDGLFYALTSEHINVYTP